MCQYDEGSTTRRPLPRSIYLFETYADQGQKTEPRTLTGETAQQ